MMSLKLSRALQNLTRGLAKRSYYSRGGPEVKVSDEELFIHKDEVVRFMRSCMEVKGCPPHHSERLALNLVEADYRGHFSHGLNRLAMYIRDIQSGNCFPSATPEIVKESVSTALVDGRNGLGVVVGEFSMKLAIEKAKMAGVGWVSARGSNHFGICQWYTTMALNEGMLGISCTNTSPLVTPTRGKVPVFGSNPFSVALPGLNGDNFMLDMSTSSVAGGKIEIQYRRGEPLPSTSWVLGADGLPTTDAYEAIYKGSGLMPLGGSEINSGYKGYALGMVVEILCGMLSGSQYGPKIRKWTDHNVPANLGQCFIAVNLDEFAPGVTERVQNLMDHLRQMTPVDPKKPVLVPGDPERAAVALVDGEQQGGIIYTPDHIISYRKLAQELGVEPMKAFRKK
ncbi:uncharacterized oxidoreductase YjmC-like [Tigriopus californicus]|uniref:uncharacterized oxidoreductase YjmC-like n=1 Tax=Tigriopus californicus TaxID=6832 RepID=UPI0027DA5A87|nr:uncharacterized oxidoreductase YjmC-like [Tigriopus californicus]